MTSPSTVSATGAESGAARSRLPPGVPVGLWLLIWLAGLAGLIGVAREHLVPSIERATRTAVSAQLSAISPAPVDAAVHGYTAHLSGSVTGEAQRRQLIAAASQVSGVRQVVDTLRTTATGATASDAGRPGSARARTPDAGDRPAPILAGGSSTTPGTAIARLDDDFGLLEAGNTGQSSQTPFRRLPSEPRITVLGAISPPWRAPVIVRPPPASAADDTIIPSAATTAGPATDAAGVQGAAPRAVAIARPADAARRVRAADGTASSDSGPNQSVQERFRRLTATPLAFRFNSDQLTTASRDVLDRLAQLLADHQNTRLDIEGHTDATGNEQDNLALSQARSSQVRTYLANRGVAPYRMLAIGYGESRPIADNNSAAGRAANRRIELRLR